MAEVRRRCERAYGEPRELSFLAHAPLLACRTGCDFSDTSKPDYDQCETGGCIGGLQCSATTGAHRPSPPRARLSFP